MFLAGRTGSKVEALAAEIRGDGRTAEAAVVDVDDRAAVEAHADDVVRAAGSLDISFNAAGMSGVQNAALVDMALDDFMRRSRRAMRRHSITATAAGDGWHRRAGAPS